MFDTWSRLVVHVAMDNTVVIEEISELTSVAMFSLTVSDITASQKAFNVV